MNEALPTILRCTHCGAGLPVGLLQESTADDNPGQVHLLSAQDYVVGRAPDCDLQVGADRNSVSRRHARLTWRDDHFEITDAGSTHGTRVNDAPLTKGAAIPLAHGDRIVLGDMAFSFASFGSGLTAPSEHYRRYLSLLGEMTSLDPGTVVQRALELLRFASGADRSYLVDAGSEPSLREWLTRPDDPSLDLSRSSIETALRTGEKLTRFLTPGVDDALTESIVRLELRRIWVSPVRGARAQPIAVVYLDSKNTGTPFDPATERLMDAVVDQIGRTLRNASLHTNVVSTKEVLEAEVVTRLRELEQSQARLIAQDHLAKLGRLVAAIAHELNNPVGAMASLSQTLGGLLHPVLHLGDEITRAFPDPGDEAAVRRLFDAALACAKQPLAETRERRKLEQALTQTLLAEQVPAAETLARRFARAGIDVDAIRPLIPLLQRHGDTVSMLVERLHTFARGLETIGDCAAGVARIVDGLKVYSHLDRSRVEEADIHQSIRVTLSVLAPRIPPDVTVETRFGAIPPFPHRPGELIQVWTNLVDNALQAMGDTGTLTIRTCDDGPTVSVSVQDTGSGVPPELGERIFELDVTSRGPGAGLGLGLPICKTLIEKDHGGSIRFESRPGRTVFTVTLPKVPPPVVAGATSALMGGDA